jgi:dihydrofolate reductase
MSFKLPNVEAILAVDNKFGLAKQNVIPWKNKTDLAFFRSKTINQVIIMGSKTFLSLPKSEPLKDRINIVITNNVFKYSNIYEKFKDLIFVNKEHVLNLLKYCYKYKTIFIIGGNQIYNMLLPYCSKIWLTQIKSDFHCDLIFDYNISNLNKFIIFEDDELEIMQLE